MQQRIKKVKDPPTTKNTENFRLIKNTCIRIHTHKAPYVTIK